MEENTNKKQVEDDFYEKKSKEDIIKELKDLSDKCEEQNKDRIEKIEYFNVFANYLRKNIPIYIGIVFSIFIFLNYGSSETNYYQGYYFLQVFKVSICILPLSFLWALIRCLKNKNVSDYYKDFTKRMLIKISLLSLISIGYLIMNVFL